jgi:hypothetical protein
MGGIERWASFLRSTMEGEKEKRAYPSLKKGRGIYTPPGKVLQGRIFRSKLGPDISPPPSHEKLLRTSRASSRFGAGYFGRIFPKVGRIFWSPLKSAKDQKMVRRASYRFKARYLAGYFQKWAG